MKQNSSEADSSVSDNSSVSKFISRWNVDGFLTKFPHERDWFLYFGNVYCFPRSFPHLKYLVKLCIYQCNAGGEGGGGRQGIGWGFNFFQKFAIKFPA